ncbi:IS3 family transposase [Acidithiobacillus montserratensis]|uniref:IS3 family transposase n=1 Tax=Acidithiobacillus montserratensis TaxID=2729135 RepID=A0ACD5HE86_9PROT
MTTKTNKMNQFSVEVRERAVRLVQDHRGEYPSLAAALASIAPKIGCSAKTLGVWVRRMEIDAGTRLGITTDETLRIKALERENKELRRANEILKLASAFFCPGGARPPSQALKGFVDQYRGDYGVEPICKVLQMAPSGYRRHAALQKNPALRSPRARRDEEIIVEIQRVWAASRQVYGADKVWRHLQREGQVVARCTVERLMRLQGWQGVRRGKAQRTTIPDHQAPRPQDLVRRQFQAERPDQLWVADFTYVSTWEGWVYVAFIIDVYARRIVGWQTSTTMRTEFVLDALEQALHARQPAKALIHHSDRGSQYLSICYTERLADAGVAASVGSTGDSYDNALAETINGLYKAEVVHHLGPWRNRSAVEVATLEWVHWYNHQRLFGPLGYIPPAEAEANYYAQLVEQPTKAA